MKNQISRLFCASLLIPVAWSQEFEIAVVKPHPANVPCGESNTYPGGRLLLSCFTLYELINEALFLQPSRSDELTGGPDWVRTDAWDVTAKAAGVAGELTPSAYRPMLLKLVENEFDLKLTKTTRELKGFRLVVDRKAKPRPGLRANAGAPYRFDLKPGLSLTAQRISMKEFATWLKMPMAAAAPVADETGLAGQYDFDLHWTPALVPRSADSPPSTDEPAIFTALREQLGLKLQAARVPRDAYVIQSVERPRGEPAPPTSSAR